VFDLYDFLLPDGAWDVPFPPLKFYGGLDISICVGRDADGNTFHVTDRIKEMMLLKRGENTTAKTVVSAKQLASIEKEETMVINHLVS
ncbi:hypothetical protein J8I29_29805, partial [Labrys sp. LIt4]